MAIDLATGLLTDNECFGGFGGAGPFFVYDREMGLFGHPSYEFMYSPRIGMHPLSEFDASILAMYEANNMHWNMCPYMFLSSTRGLLIVEAVDWSMRQYFHTIYDNWPIGQWWLPPEGFLGQFALMYNMELVTDFIFEDGLASRMFTGEDFVLAHAAMRMGDMWGLIYKDGSTVLPFIFEHLLVIDGNTAFAKYNGMYGILDFLR